MTREEALDLLDRGIPENLRERCVDMRRPEQVQIRSLVRSLWEDAGVHLPDDAFTRAPSDAMRWPIICPDQTAHDVC